MTWMDPAPSARRLGQVLRLSLVSSVRHGVRHSVFGRRVCAEIAMLDWTYIPYLPSTVPTKPCSLSSPDQRSSAWWMQLTHRPHSKPTTSLPRSAPTLNQQTWPCHAHHGSSRRSGGKRRRLRCVIVVRHLRWLGSGESTAVVLRPVSGTVTERAWRTRS